MVIEQMTTSRPAQARHTAHRLPTPDGAGSIFRPFVRVIFTEDRTWVGLPGNAYFQPGHPIPK